MALFRKHDIWLTKTVVLETEWVLRSAFDFEPTRIADALTGLIALPRVRCEDPAAVSAALEAMSAGLDFADALPLTSSRNANEGYASFDARLARRARKHWPTAIVFTP